MTEDTSGTIRTEDETWDRGDGQPEPRLLDEALDRILEVCQPAQIVLFGSGARGELRRNSDLDLLIVDDTAADDANDTASRVRTALDELPRADVLTATTTEMREGKKSLCGIQRTIATEGVVLYRKRRRLPYAPRPRPPRDDTPADPETAHRESEDLASMAAHNLRSAQATEKIRNSMRPSPVIDACDRARIAGSARKAIEFALQAVIVCAGRRPYAWKKPAALAAEARAAGAAVPEIDPAALEHTGTHYTGLPFPGEPAPSEEEAREALELADRIVEWAQETVRTSHAGEAHEQHGEDKP